MLLMNPKRVGEVYLQVHVRVHPTGISLRSSFLPFCKDDLIQYCCFYTYILNISPMIVY